MKVLIVGSGGREAALAWKVAQSPLLTALYVQERRPGLPPIAEVAAGDVLAEATSLGLDLVVVGPEVPLAEGLADALTDAGVAVFGPTRAAARLESSKGWSKDFMLRHGIPTAAYGRFVAAEAAHAFVHGPCVVKADGLAAGKGVFVCDDAAQAHEAIDRLLAGGGAIVIEERLTGPELSVMALCDGERFVLLPASRDHKRRYDGGAGPNTGGMGAFCPVPDTDALVTRVGDEVIAPALAGMRAEGHPFRGCLYAGMMLTPDGPKALEFNVRFGDPECQVLMMMIEEDLLPRLHQCALGRLDPAPLALADGAACVVVAVSEGYPGSYAKGRAITLPAPREDRVVFHAGTRFGHGDVVETSGGRVLGIAARAATLPGAVEAAYEALGETAFLGMGSRSDIGRGHNEGRGTCLR